MFTICKQQENLSGDIICVKPEYAVLTNRYSIECKTGYEKSSFNSIMKGNKDDFINFCKQCCDDASKANKLPLIIFKKKLHNILVAVKETDDINSFMEDIKCLTVRFDPVILLPSFKVYDMDEFFSKIEYDNLMECSYDDIRRSYNTISST
jgi:hypothetical protein